MIKKLWFILAVAVVLIGGGIAAYFIYNANKSEQVVDDRSEDIEFQVTVTVDKDMAYYFVALIDAGLPNDALDMMSAKNTSDENIKQSWVANFSGIESASLGEFTPIDSRNWSDTYRQYKIVFNIELGDDSTNTYFTSGENERNISFIYEEEGWWIDDIATSQ